MSDVRRITRSYTSLRQQLRADDETFIEQLNKRGVLTELQLKNINETRSRETANDKLLMIVLNQSQEMYEQFLTCLKLTGQQSVLKMLTDPGSLYLY